MGLDERLLDRVLLVAARREQVRRSKGRVLVSPNEHLVGHDLASARAFDQLGVASPLVFQWTALHGQPYLLHRVVPDGSLEDRDAARPAAPATPVRHGPAATIGGMNPFSPRAVA